MRRTLHFFLLMAIFSSAAYAASVNVNVEDIVSSETKESHAVSGGALSSSAEVYNSGSVPYAARLSISVYNGSDEIFIGWSSAQTLMPGERKTFKELAYSAPGNFTAKVFGHYANDAFLLSEYNFSIKDSAARTPTVTLSSPRIYESRVTLGVKSGNNQDGATIIPLDYPKTWIFEQKELPALSGGESVRVSVPYSADVFAEKKVRMIAISKEGAVLGEFSFTMKRETGFSRQIALLKDWLSGTI